MIGRPGIQSTTWPQPAWAGTRRVSWDEQLACLWFLLGGTSTERDVPLMRYLAVVWHLLAWIAAGIRCHLPGLGVLSREAAPSSDEVDGV